jgi:hypothetical protein
MRELGMSDHIVDRNTNIVIDPPDLQPIIDAISSLEGGRSDIAVEVQGIREELRCTSEEIVNTIRRDLAAMLSDIRQDLNTLREESRGLPQTVADLRQTVLQLDQRVDNSEVLQALRGIREPDHQAIAKAVASRINHADFSQQLKRLEPDYATMASYLVDRMKQVGLRVDQGEVLNLMQRAKSPDSHEIAAAVHERLGNSLKVDRDEILKELKRHRRECGLDSLAEVVQASEANILECMQQLTENHHSALNTMRAPADSEIAVKVCELIRKSSFFPDPADMLSEIWSAAQPELAPIHEALCEIHESVKKAFALKLDHPDVMAAISRIRVPDKYEIALAVRDQLKESNLIPGRPDFAPILEAIQSAEIDVGSLHEAINPLHEAISSINIQVDHGEVLRAIEKVPAPDHTPILKAINQIQVPDHTPILKAINQIQVPDHNLIAGAVYERLRGVEIDHDAIAGAVYDKLKGVEVDLGPVHEAISNISIRVDHGEVLQAIEKVRVPDNSALLQAMREISVPDHNLIARAVHDRLSRFKGFQEGDVDLRRNHGEMKVDHREVLQAIEQVNEAVDKAAVLQSIAMANLRAEVLGTKKSEVQLEVAPLTTVTQMPPVSETNLAEAPQRVIVQTPRQTPRLLLQEPHCALVRKQVMTDMHLALPERSQAPIELTIGMSRVNSEPGLDSQKMSPRRGPARQPPSVWAPFGTQ